MIARAPRASADRRRFTPALALHERRG